MSDVMERGGKLTGGGRRRIQAALTLMPIEARASRYPGETPAVGCGESDGLLEAGCERSRRGWSTRAGHGKERAATPMGSEVYGRCSWRIGLQGWSVRRAESSERGDAPTASDEAGAVEGVGEGEHGGCHWRSEGANQPGPGASGYARPRVPRRSAVQTITELCQYRLSIS